MNQKKIDYLAEAMSFAKACHNMFVFLDQGYEIHIPGDPDGSISKAHQESVTEMLHEFIVKAHEHGQDVPDYLLLEHNVRLDITPWKAELKEAVNEE